MSCLSPAGIARQRVRGWALFRAFVFVWLVSSGVFKSKSRSALWLPGFFVFGCGERFCFFPCPAASANASLRAPEPEQIDGHRQPDTRTARAGPGCSCIWLRGQDLNL